MRPTAAATTAPTMPSATLRKPLLPTVFPPDWGRSGVPFSFAMMITNQRAARYTRLGGICILNVLREIKRTGQGLQRRLQTRNRYATREEASVTIPTVLTDCANLPPLPTLKEPYQSLRLAVVPTARKRARVFPLAIAVSYLCSSLSNNARSALIRSSLSWYRLTS